jgi:hypothetical protein
MRRISSVIHLGACLMTNRFLVALMVGVLSTAAWAQAQADQSKRQRFIERFDTNGDGRLDADERDRARQLLKEIGHGAPKTKPLPQTLFPARRICTSSPKGRMRFRCTRPTNCAIPSATR